MTGGLPPLFAQIDRTTKLPPAPTVEALRQVLIAGDQSTQINAAVAAYFQAHPTPTAQDVQDLVDAAIANGVLAEVDAAVQDYFTLHPQSFLYDQPTDSTHWVITHPLDHYPAVTVIDSAGTEWEAAATYPSLNTVVLDFNFPMSGTAQLT